MKNFINKDFYVLGENLEILGIMPNIISIVYSEKYQNIGDFEAQVALTEETVFLVKTENIIVFDVERGIAGIIGKVKEEISDRGNVLNISGNLTESYLSRRICWGLYSKTGKPSEIVQDMLNKNVLSPSVAERKIEGINFVPVTFEGEESISFQSTGGIISDNVVALCEANNMGFKMPIDIVNGSFEFTLYKGTDRTINQNVVSQCVFSMEFENILSAVYEKNTKDSKNIFIVAGEGEGKDRKMVTVGDTSLSGKNRIEFFVDAGDVQSTDEEGNTIPANEYNQMLKQRGEEVRSEYKVVENFSCEINPVGNLTYGKDFFLGDKVTANIDLFGLQIDVIVSEVSHTITYEGEDLEFTFGYGAPTFTEKLKRRLRG